MAAWAPIVVTFSGLILFVQDPALKDITHAVLADGRAGHHHHGSTYPRDRENCGHLVRQDFDHIGLISWMPLGSGDEKPGGKELNQRYRITYRWRCENDRDCTGEVRKGAQPLRPTRKGDMPRMKRNGPELRSFSWVPSLELMGMEQSISKETYEGVEHVPTVVLVQMPLLQGTIGTSGFAWAAGDDGRYWIPEMIFTGEAGTGAGSRRRRAAAEEVEWEPERPPMATAFEIYAAPLDPELGAPKLLARFEATDTPVNIRVSNSPLPRCIGAPHPGRRNGMPTAHFEMFYDMLSPSSPTAAVGVGHHLAPADKRIPWVPNTFRSNWAWLFWKNAVPYQRMRPLTGAAATSTSGGTLGAGPESLSPPSGTKERPICVPAVVSSSG